MLGLMITGISLLSLSASLVTEPLCQGTVCASNEECRVRKQCDASDQCSVQPVCISQQDSTMTSGGCIVGEPLLQVTGQGWGIVTCHSRAPCPAGSYCSTVLQDVAARCCLSDKVSPAKSGTCPQPDPSGEHMFCVDRCLTDNDCHGDWKCCMHVCDKRCTPV